MQKRMLGRAGFAGSAERREPIIAAKHKSIRREFMGRDSMEAHVLQFKTVATICASDDMNEVTCKKEGICTRNGGFCTSTKTRRKALRSAARSSKTNLPANATTFAASRRGAPGWRNLNTRHTSGRVRTS